MQPPPTIYPYVLPDEVPVKPKNLIFQCVTSGRTQTLLQRNGGTLWFKDYCGGGGKEGVWVSEEDFPWEQLDSPKEEDWRRFRSKLEELKVWELQSPSKPEDQECGGYVEFRLVLGFPDRMIRLRGTLNEGAWREYEDEEGNETGGIRSDVSHDCQGLRAPYREGVVL